MKKIFLLLFFITVILAFIIVMFLPEKENIHTPVNTEGIRGKFDEQYSKLDTITPGKSTMKDVLETNGIPNNKIENLGKTYFYYNTPSSEYQNIVLFKNDSVVYAKEEVFRKTKGAYSDYIKRYGKPSLTLYELDNPYLEWSIFLDKGIGVFHQEDFISALLYFSSQNKNAFINNIGNDLDMTSEKPEEKGLPSSLVL